MGCSGKCSDRACCAEKQVNTSGPCKACRAVDVTHVAVLLLCRRAFDDCVGFLKTAAVRNFHTRCF